MPGNTRWNECEIQTLKQLYGKIPTEKLQKKYLPGRSQHAIIEMANRLTLKKAADRETMPWTTREINFLKTNFTSMDYPELLKHLPGRTQKAIACKINQLGLKRRLKKPGSPAQTTPWSGEEENIVVKYAKTLTVAEIHKRYLPNRTPRAIQSKMRMLGLSEPRPPKWTEKERDIIMKNADKSGVVLMQLLPERSYGAIRNQLTAMRLQGLI